MIFAVNAGWQSIILERTKEPDDKVVTVVKSEGCLGTSLFT